jgi:SAM-dependent methyltransferase
MGERHKLHRKLWEWCFIAQALSERDMLRPGRRGLGFAVGAEPLVSLFAAHGCQVVATDLDRERACQIGWAATGQHVAQLDELNSRGICPAEEFKRNVSFRVVDMNTIPADLRNFDFVWSSCSFEHLGTIELGIRFLENMARCLRPNGVAVHTTEFNVRSNDATVEEGGFVIFRRRDTEEMARRLRAQGFSIDLDFTLGDGEADHFIDRPPYIQKPHLKLELLGYVSTSIGLIFEHTGRGNLRCRLRNWWNGLRPLSRRKAG